MRVRFLSYPHIGLGDGGLQLQIRRTAEALAGQGCDVLWYDPWSSEVTDVDVLHVFGLHPSVEPIVRRYARLGVPVVLSPIFNRFRIPWQVQRMLYWCGDHVPTLYTDLALELSVLREVDVTVCLNLLEAERLAHATGAGRLPIEIVPNGVDPHPASDVNTFRSEFALNSYVLSVGTIEPRKNQLRLAQAAHRSGIHVAMVGPIRDSRYADRVVSAGGDSVTLTGEIPHGPLLWSGYAGADAFALVSVSEVMPIVLGEAAAAGLRIVVSESIDTPEAYIPRSTRVSPKSAQSIAKGLVAASQGGSGGGSALLDVVSWDDVARRVRCAYESVVKT